MKSTFYQVYDWLDYMPLKMYLCMMCICMKKCRQVEGGVSTILRRSQGKNSGRENRWMTASYPANLPCSYSVQRSKSGNGAFTFRLCLPTPIKASKIIPNRHGHSQDDLNSPSPRFFPQVVLACTKSTIRDVMVLYSCVTPPQRRKTTGSCTAVRPNVKEI